MNSAHVQLTLSDRFEALLGAQRGSGEAGELLRLARAQALAASALDDGVIEPETPEDCLEGFVPERPAMLARLRAAVERRQNPGFQCCERCLRPWVNLTPHITAFGSADWGFPLCEPCWQRLATPRARLPYYRLLYERWEAELPASSSLLRWPALKRAILAGQ